MTPLERVLELACLAFQTFLFSEEGAEAREVLKERDYDEAAIRKYRIGFAPAGWTTLLSMLLKEDGVTPDLLRAAGLAIKGKDGKADFSFFRNRIIFPIWSPEGKVVAFGGRALGSEDEVKYLNSPETEVYSKAKTLYGLYQSLPLIRQNGTVFVAEGYFDVLRPHIIGFENTVAPCGTSLTIEQIELLREHGAKKLIFIFDGDKAGKNAAERAIKLCLEADMRCGVVSLPEGEDPDTFIKTVDGFRANLRQAKIGYRFLMEQARQRANSQWPTSAIQAKVCLGEEIVRLSNIITNSQEREDCLSLLARRIGVNVDLLERESQRLAA